MSLYRNPPDAVKYLEQWDEYYIEGVRKPNHNVSQLFSLKDETALCEMVDELDLHNTVRANAQGYCNCYPGDGFMEFGPTPQHDEEYAEAWLKAELGYCF